MRIGLSVVVVNARAIGLCHKFGFKTKGRLRAYASGDGQSIDVYLNGRLHPRRPVLTGRCRRAVGAGRDLISLPK